MRLVLMEATQCLFEHTSQVCFPGAMRLVFPHFEQLYMPSVVMVSVFLQNS